MRLNKTFLSRSAAVVVVGTVAWWGYNVWSSVADARWPDPAKLERTKVEGWLADAGIHAKLDRVYFADVDAWSFIVLARDMKLDKPWTKNPKVITKSAYNRISYVEYRPRSSVRVVTWMGGRMLVSYQLRPTKFKPASPSNFWSHWQKALVGE